ncbi:MAG: calcium-binding protein, partial [Sphingomicrobium sp.]
GMISRDEFAKGRELRIEKRVVMNGSGMHGMGMGKMMGGGMLKTADVNKDGRVSLQEATATALQHFDRTDVNRDGKLTPDEMRAARQMMMQIHTAG